jgi:hypothetical protein
MCQKLIIILDFETRDEICSDCDLSEIETFRYSEIFTRIKVAINYIFYAYLHYEFQSQKISSPVEKYSLRAWEGIVRGRIMGVRYPVRDREDQTSASDYPPSEQIVLDASLKRPKHAAVCENIYTAKVFCKNNHTAYNKASHFFILCDVCVTWTSPTVDTRSSLGIKPPVRDADIPSPSSA